MHEHGRPEDAELRPEEIGYVNAHGTATVANDGNEAEALNRSFGAYCEHLLVSSTKPVHGHTLGAAGAIELADFRDGVERADGASEPQR